MLNFSQMLGYTKDDKGNYIIVPEEAAIVKRIYREFLSGYSAAQIANGLMEDKIATASQKEPMFKEWTEEEREKMKSKWTWYPSTIRHMLTNEKYKGCCQCQKTFKRDLLSERRTINNGEVDSIYLENSHPAIISPEMWDMVQAEYERRNNLRTFAGDGVGRYSSKYPMSGYIYCNSCGSKYRRHNKRTKENGTEATWVCINHKINGNEACPAQYVLETDIENAYMRALSKISEEYKETLETIRANVHNEIDDRLYEEIDDINGQLERKQEEMLNLIKALSRKEITEAEYNEKVIIMTAEVDSLIIAQRERQNKKDSTKLAEERLKEIDEVISGSLDTTKFDAEIFKRVVEIIEINGRESLKVKFRCGLEVEEKL